MSTVDEIEDAIRKLPDEDRATLRAWFAEFDAESRLDVLADEALRDRREGRCPRPLARDSDDAAKGP